MKKVLMYIGIGIVILDMVIVQAACGQTLSDYLQEAAQNNPGLKASYAEYEASLQRVSQVKGLSDPTFKASAFGQMVETRVGQQMTQFSLEQMFPWFGTLKAKGDVAALEAEAKLEQFYTVRNELVYNVKAAYYPLYEVDAMVKLQEANLTILETYKSLALSRFQQSKGTMVDVVRVNIMIDETKTTIDLLKEQRIALTSAFNRLLNRADDTAVMVADTLTLSDAVFSRDSVLNNPSVIALDKMKQASVAAQRVAKKEAMPMIGLGFNYIVIGERTDMDMPDNGKDAYMPMVSVSLPIYRKKYKAMTREASLMGDVYDLKKEETVNELNAMYTMTTFEMTQARRMIELYSTQVEQTNQAVKLLLAALHNANADVEEILRMEQSLLTYRIKNIQAVVEYKTAEARLEYLLGR